MSLLGFPYHPLKTKKGTLFIPRLLLGLVYISRNFTGSLREGGSRGGEYLAKLVGLIPFFVGLGFPCKPL